jgi:hypothetical protein
MAKASAAVAEKIEVLSSNNLKPPQFSGKKGECFLMWKMKFEADMVMKGLYDAFQSKFKAELPTQKNFDLMDETEKKYHDAVVMNRKAIMQFALLFSTVLLLNKLNCEKRKNRTNWPSGKAHHVMSVVVKEFEPEDTMAEMEMEHVLAKLKLGPKKDPNKLLHEFASIECRYSLELSKSNLLEYHLDHQHYSLQERSNAHNRETIG